MIAFRHLNWAMIPGSIVHDTATIPREVGSPELFYYQYLAVTTISLAGLVYDLNTLRTLRGLRHNFNSTLIRSIRNHLCDYKAIAQAINSL